MAEILSPDELAALLEQMKDGESEAAAEEAEAEASSLEAGDSSDASPTAFGSSGDGGSTGSDGPAGPDVSNKVDNVEVLLNLPVDVRVEIGRAKVAIVDLLNLCQGTVIELDHLASDMIDLTMNDKIVAQGEAVVVNENFGIRILEVDSVRDRIMKL